MKRKILMAAVPALVLTAPFGGRAVPVLGGAWGEVDWESVEHEIEAAPGARSVGGNADGIIDVKAGRNIDVPAETLRKLAGRNMSLALQAGGGIAVSASGRELDAVEQGLRITVTDEEDLIPDEVSSRVLQDVLYSRFFAMEEKTVYDIRLNIHFNLGRKYAGKYANLYHFDEESSSMRYDGTFVITGGGLAMFSLEQGDEYILTVTETLPRGGRFVYLVTAGDCLIRIANANQTTVNALLAANPEIQDADVIYAGQLINVVR